MESKFAILAIAIVFTALTTTPQVYAQGFAFGHHRFQQQQQQQAAPTTTTTPAPATVPAGNATSTTAPPAAPVPTPTPQPTRGEERFGHQFYGHNERFIGPFGMRGLGLGFVNHARIAGFGMYQNLAR